MRGVARTKFLPEVIAPVRPSAKTRFQDVAMTEYIQWRDPQGRIFDPWLRSHVAAGGRIESVCELSMVVEQPLEFWRAWTGEPLAADSKVHLDGALAPIEIDVPKGIGRYVEPNVWVRHAV